MAESIAISFMVIAGAAVLAPLLAELLRRWHVPGVLFELLLGIAIGPSILGWVQVDEFITGISQLGMAMLFFMAGYEIDFARLSGPPLRRAGVSWATSLGLGLGLGVILVQTDVVESSLLVGLAITTTAMGTLMPILRDRGVIETRFGSFVIAAGTVGEFGPIVAITILLGSSKPIDEGFLLILFAAFAVVVALVATRPQPPAFVEMMRRHLITSSQLPVRIVLLLLTVLAVAAAALGLDNLLGAFAAGIIVRLALAPAQRASLSPRLEAIGFGFLIPVFFVVSGVNFDLRSLTDSFSSVTKVPIYLLAMLAVRGLPAMLVYRGILGTRQRVALTLLQSTALPLLVVLTQIGLSTGQMTSESAAALMGAGMLSVLILPLSGFAALGSTPLVETDATDDELGDGTMSEL